MKRTEETLFVLFFFLILLNSCSTRPTPVSPAPVSVHYSLNNGTLDYERQEKLNKTVQRIEEEPIYFKVSLDNGLEYIRKGKLSFSDSVRIAEYSAILKEKTKMKQNCPKDLQKGIIWNISGHYVELRALQENPIKICPRQHCILELLPGEYIVIVDYFDGGKNLIKTIKDFIIINDIPNEVNALGGRYDWQVFVSY
jgi:hypothetical protein